MTQQTLNPQTAQKQTESGVLQSRLAKAINENPATLAAHGIDKEKFAAACQEALMRVPGIADCSEKSFFDAIHKCCADGLIPDGNEAVIYPKRRTPDSGQGYSVAVYLPMLHGIMRVLHETTGAEVTSGHVLKSEEASLVITEGTEPSIQYTKNLDVKEDDYVIGAWALARIPGKAPIFRILNKHDIEEAKKKSASYSAGRDSPWGKKEGSRGYDGFMAEKTAMKSLANRLQYCTKSNLGKQNPLVQMLQHDDEYRELLPETTQAQLEHTPMDTMAVPEAESQQAPPVEAEKKKALRQQRKPQQATPQPVQQTIYPPAQEVPQSENDLDLTAGDLNL